MDIKRGFGNALKRIRKARGLTQEHFDVVSSRTYLSTLERGLKSPTLEKLVELTEVMNIHPLTLLVAAFAEAQAIAPDVLLDTVLKELEQLNNSLHP